MQNQNQAVHLNVRDAYTRCPWHWLLCLSASHCLRLPRKKMTWHQVFQEDLLIQGQKPGIPKPAGVDQHWGGSWIKGWISVS
jgi:hypothetical protein